MWLRSLFYSFYFFFFVSHLYRYWYVWILWALYSCSSIVYSKRNWWYHSGCPTTHESVSFIFRFKNSFRYRITECFHSSFSTFDFVFCRMYVVDILFRFFFFALFVYYVGGALFGSFFAPNTVITAETIVDTLDANISVWLETKAWNDRNGWDPLSLLCMVLLPFLSCSAYIYK